MTFRWHFWQVPRAVPLTELLARARVSQEQLNDTLDKMEREIDVLLAATRPRPTDGKEHT